MPDEVDRFFKKQTEIDRAMKPDSVAREIARLTRQDDAHRQLRDQALTASGVYRNSAVNTALVDAKIRSLTNAMTAAQFGDISSAQGIGKRDVALENISFTAARLSKMFVGGQLSISQQATLGKLASDISGRVANLYPKFDPATLAGLHAATEQFNSRFREPRFQETIELARQAVAGISISQSSLRKMMGQLDGSWARVGDELGSARAIGSLAAIERAISGARPFGDAATRILRGELGDWRGAPILPPDIVDPLARTAYYEDRGYNRSLTDFPAEVVDQVLAFVDGEGDNGDELRTDQVYHRLSRFERRLRLFIESKLRSHFGEQWERQIPADVFSDWEVKRQNAVDRGDKPHPRLIDYADFRHYEKIILRKDNWRLVFNLMFRRKSDIEESLCRLAPVRITTMHAGVVTADDALLVEVETKRVLNAIARS